MEAHVRITVLGSGSAWPTPRPGCDCDPCAEARRDPRLRRTRSALLVETTRDVLLLDSGPDVMFQLERRGGEPRVDRVLVSHTHADHVLGLDDLVHVRANRDALLFVHAAEHHRRRIAEIFPHLLRDGKERIAFDAWEHGTRIEREGVTLEGFETGHRDTFPTTAVLLHVETREGTRRVAYATDMGMTLPDRSREALQGIDVLVGDGSYLGPAGYGHPGTDDVIRLARELDVGRLAFTHIGHFRGVDDRSLRERLGPDIGVLRDGDDLLSALD